MLSECPAIRSDVTKVSQHAWPLVQLLLFDEDIDVVRDTINLVHEVNVRRKGKSGMETPLSQAIRLGWREHAVLMLKNGAHVSLAPGVDGVTPLHQACASDMKGLALLMIKSAPNVDIRDAAGRTPLMWAVDRSWTDGRVATCLEAGADPSLLDHEGRSALHTCVMPAAVPVFVDMGCDPMAEDNHGDAPMHVLVAQGDHAEALAELIQAGAHPDTLSGKHTTCLHMCAELDRPKCSALLLAADAEPDAEDSAGQTPLFIAAKLGHNDVAYQLLRAGAQVDATDEHGDTPLFVAVRAGHEHIAKELVHNGADVAARNNKDDSVRREAEAAGMLHLLSLSSDPAPRKTLFTKSVRMDVSPAVRAVAAARASIVAPQVHTHGAHAHADAHALLPGRSSSASSSVVESAFSPLAPPSGEDDASVTEHDLNDVPDDSFAGSSGSSFTRQTGNPRVAAAPVGGSTSAKGGAGGWSGVSAPGPRLSRAPVDSSHVLGGTASDDDGASSVASMDAREASFVSEEEIRDASPAGPGTLKFTREPTVKFRTTSGWNLEVPASAEASAREAEQAAAARRRGESAPTFVVSLQS